MEIKWKNEDQVKYISEITQSRESPAGVQTAADWLSLWFWPSGQWVMLRHEDFKKKKKNKKTKTQIPAVTTTC